MRRPLLLILFSILATLASAQDLKVDFYDGEFFFAEEDYEEALYAFNKVYTRGYEGNAYINYRMGQCMLRIPGRKKESIAHLEKAVTNISTRSKEGKFKEELAPPDALLYLGNAYRINQDLENACDSYKKYAEYIDPKDLDSKAFVDQQILSCGHAVVALNNPVTYSIGNLGQVNETHFNRYNVVVSDDLSTMAFMGKNPFYNSVQVSIKEADGTWSVPKNITPSIVSDGNMDVVALSPDGKTMLLAVSDEFDSNIYSSVYENDRWNPATTLGKPVNSRYYESHATYADNKKTLYFTSNRKESMGGMDIFKSELLPNNTWSEPENLGPSINTVLNEESPFLSPDGKRLYFSSQGHTTIGGFDLFYAELQSDGSWGTPMNVGYPLNTTDDDLAFSPASIKEDGSTLVFAKGEDGNKYGVYKFEFINRDTKPVVVPMDESDEVMAEEVPVKVEVPVKEEVPVEVEEVKEEVVEVIEEMPIQKPEVEKPTEKYLIRPIFFAFESYSLTGPAATKLDGLTSLMQRFPGLKLEVTGHTDALGTYEYNQRLSTNRANAVAKYLLLNGISKDRIKITGMSESEHVARNKTRDNKDAPQGRALNRRVQFKVSITEKVIIELEKIQVPDHLKLDD